MNLIMKLLKPYWEPAKVILDIGAHIGSHSFIYSFFNREAKIYAFEPQTEIFKVLCENMQTRGNVVCVNTCVGHTSAIQVYQIILILEKMQKRKSVMAKGPL